MRPLLEIAVETPTDARRAVQAGADRIELAQALGVGGLTPSAAAIRGAVALAEAPVIVLIRPRLGGFHYAADELEVMEADIRAAIATGAAGVAVGALEADGRSLDLRAMERFVRAAGPGRVTCHRAFDALEDRFAGLRQLQQMGVLGVLSAGGATRASEGLAELARLASAAPADFEVIAAGGVRAAAASGLRAAGIRAWHASAARAVPSPGQPRGLAAAVALAEGTHLALDESLVLALDAARR